MLLVMLLSCGHGDIGTQDATTHQGSGKHMPQPDEVARPPSAPLPCRPAANWASQSKRRLQLPAAPATCMPSHLSFLPLLWTMLKDHKVRHEHLNNLQAAAVPPEAVLLR